jgi:hypothetical protein
LAWFLWRWKTRAVGPAQEATLLFERFLEEAGLTRKSHQTAREVAGAFVTLRSAYERARFAGDKESLQELRRLVREFQAEGQRRS